MPLEHCGPTICRQRLKASQFFEPETLRANIELAPNFDSTQTYTNNSHEKLHRVNRTVNIKDATDAARLGYVCGRRTHRATLQRWRRRCAWRRIADTRHGAITWPAPSAARREYSTITNNHHRQMLRGSQIVRAIRSNDGACFFRVQSPFSSSLSYPPAACFTPIPTAAITKTALLFLGR